MLSCESARSEAGVLEGRQTFSGPRGYSGAKRRETSGEDWNALGRFDLSRRVGINAQRPTLRREGGYRGWLYVWARLNIQHPRKSMRLRRWGGQSAKAPGLLPKTHAEGAN